MIHFSCSCGMKFQVKDDFAGRSSKCPTCKQAIVVPFSDPTEANVPENQIDGTASSLDKAGVDGGVTLDREVASPDQKSVGELLARQTKKGQRYIIEKEIARGGMGAVLRAVDCDIRREVAIKYMLSETDSKKKLRFIEEAQITGQLEHPNIVPIHELGVDAQKRLFFSMKMVNGRSLAQVLDELRQHPKTADKAYTLGRLLNIFVSVCNGLAYGHARGVVHRDLKPANIMVGDFGEVYVMDWGLAKVLKGGQVERAGATAVGGLAGEIATTKRSSKVVTSRESEADLTQDGAILGTPVYMPPEQANGQIDATDQRSDIYSLGAILYEILTLQAPIEKEGGYLAILMRVTQGEIVPPEKRDPKRARAGKMPRELSAIAMKALAKNPQDRYQNVEALRSDIERFQEGRSVSAKEDTLKEMAWKLVKRNKGVSAALFVLVPVLLIVIGFAFKNYLANKKNETELVALTRKAVPALTLAARQVANSGNLKEAMEQVDLTLLYEPNDADAHLLRGQLFLVQKNWTAGRAELEQCLQQRNDADLKKLLELCVIGKENDAAVLFDMAEVLIRQNGFGLSSPLMAEVQLKVTDRQRLVPLYQKQIEANWPSLGNRLRLEKNAQLNLELRDCKQVASLEPLKGMQLCTLNLWGCPITNLTPLQGMPLIGLDLGNCGQVQDLAPLHGMPLTSLSLGGCGQVRDLTPLKGMPLTSLSVVGCGQVRDLTPLKGMALTSLNLGGCGQVADLTLLQGMPLIWLNLGDCGLVGDLRTLHGMPLTTLYLRHCGLVRDLTPLQGMKLTSMDLAGCGQLVDLTPLKGMKLTMLNLHDCSQVRELTPLQGMPLTSLYLYGCGQVRDLTPLQGMNLTEISLPPKGIPTGMDVLRRMKSLAKISGMSAEEFWKKYDAAELNK